MTCSKEDSEKRGESHFSRQNSGGRKDTPSAYTRGQFKRIWVELMQYMNANAVWRQDINAK